MSQSGEIKRIFLESSRSEIQEWHKGEFLCREGNRIGGLYFITEGKFRVFRTMNNGREKLYRIYSPGAVIGDLEVFLGSDSASCSVQCAEKARTLVLPIADIQLKRDQYRDLIFALGQGLARKVHENSISEAINTSYPLEVRLAHYYLLLQDPALMAQNLGQLSEWMGCSYRHLTRNLASLEKKGAIQKRKNREGYAAADRVLLGKIAGPMLPEEGNRLIESGGE